MYNAQKEILLDVPFHFMYSSPVQSDSYLPYFIELINGVSHSRKQSNSCYHLHKDTASTPEQEDKLSIQSTRRIRLSHSCQSEHWIKVWLESTVRHQFLSVYWTVIVLYWAVPANFHSVTTPSHRSFFQFGSQPYRNPKTNILAFDPPPPTQRQNF